MTPDTAALRRDHYDYDCDGHCDDCGERHPCTVRALCDAADEVERLRADAERAQAHHREVTMVHMANLAAERDASRRECDGTSALAGEALERALVAEARLVEATAQIKRLATDRDASRTAHAALVADLRALVGGDELVSQRAVNPDEYTRRTGDRVPSYLAFYQGAADLAAVIRALLDRHAPTTGETP